VTVRNTSIPELAVQRNPTIAHSRKRERVSSNWRLSNLNKYLPLLILIVSIAIIYRGWFASGAVAWSDWRFHPASRLNDYWGIPSLWDGANGTGGVNTFGGPLLPVLFAESLFYHIGIDFTVALRLAWLYGGLLVCAFATYTLAVELFSSRIAGVISALLAISNTYIALIMTGGQFTVGNGYFWMAPTLLFFYRALRRPIPSRLVLPALCVSIQVMYDLRSTYITFGVLLLLALFYVLAQRSVGRALRAILAATAQFLVIGVVTILVHLFWLLPVHYAQQSGGVSLPTGYDGLFWVHVLSYMHLSHAFALFHPFWYQNNISPQPIEVSPVYFLLPLPIFAVFLRRRLTFMELFLFALALLSILFVKGSSAPAGGIYEWMFTHFIGFSLFRDPSKFFQPLALAYALLLGRVASTFPHSIPAETGHAVRGWTKRIVDRTARVLVPAACLGLVLLQAVPVAANTTWGALAPQVIPTGYAAFNRYVDRQPEFFRIMWYPTNAYGSFSSLHPQIALSDVGNNYFSKQLPNPSDSASWAYLPHAMDMLQALSVKYVVVADYAANTPAQYRSNTAQALQLVRRAFPSFPEMRFGETHVFVNRDYVPQAFVPTRDVSQASVIAALHYKSTLQSSIKNLGGVGSYTSTCHTCLFLASHNHTFTRQDVIVQHAIHPFLLIWNQSYDPNWVASIEPTSLSQPFWWTWTHPSTLQRFHLQTNGFANAWWITRPGTYRIVIEYWPQRLTDVGWFIAWATMLICLIVASMTVIRNRLLSFRAVDTRRFSPNMLSVNEPMDIAVVGQRDNCVPLQRSEMPKQGAAISMEAGGQDAAGNVAGWWDLVELRRRFTSSSLLRHNVLMFGANIATSALAYLYHPIVGRFLGASGYGTILSLGALSTILLIPSQVLTNIANKFTADLVAQGRIGEVNYLFRRLTLYSLLIGVLTTSLFIVFSPAIAPVLKLSSPQIIIISSLGYVLSYSGALNTGVIQGRQQFGWFALLNFLSSFLRLPATFLVLAAGFGITGVLIGGLVQGMILYAVTFLPMRDFLRVPQVRVPSLKPLLVYSLGSALALGGGTLLVNTDTVLAKTFLTPADAGYYGALVTVGRIVLFVGGSLVWVMFPKVAALQQQGDDPSGVLAWTMAGVAILSTGVVVAFWLYPSEIIRLILHGTPPQIVTQSVVWFGLAMLFQALANVLIYYFLSLGKMTFVPILLACCVLQAILIAVWHQNVTQLVAAMVAVMALLLVGLVTLYTVQARRATRRTS